MNDLFYGCSSIYTIPDMKMKYSKIMESNNMLFDCINLSFLPNNYKKYNKNNDKSIKGCINLIV